MLAKITLLFTLVCQVFGVLGGQEMDNTYELFVDLDIQKNLDLLSLNGLSLAPGESK